MNKLKFACLIIAALTFTVHAQQTSSAGVKRARTPEDYQAGTLKELAAKLASADSRGNKMETMIVDPDLSPTRVRATYAGLTRRTLEAKAEVIRQWARLYAGALETYKPYEVDVLFTEDGKQYWLTFTQKKLTNFWDSKEWSKPVDLFLIRMGALKTSNNWEPVLLVENFQKPK
ncbi:MAG TPA: hypothetical protein VLA93_11985 [Pyrinomonadaceae bacterium]|nr:hypothetical protein [Pyrinomonadaceae bacterium]